MNESCWAVSAVESFLPFLIPVVVLIGAFAAAIMAMILKSRERERLHKERMFLAERGLEIPRELYGIEEKKTRDYRTTRVVLLITGIFMIVTGIGVLIGVGIQDGIREAAPGLIVSAIGVGLLIGERMIARRFVSANEGDRTD
ncbi:MAG: DUF6249 domain-containing protein [Candidatus Eisenbacteria bacterium]